jgi:hypothetical protein
MAAGVLIGAVLGLAVAQTVAILGFCATATWHASGGCGSRARVSRGARAVKARCKGTRKWLHSSVVE